MRRAVPRMPLQEVRAGTSDRNGRMSAIRLGEVEGALHVVLGRRRVAELSRARASRRSALITDEVANDRRRAGEHRREGLDRRLGRRPRPGGSRRAPPASRRNSRSASDGRRQRRACRRQVAQPYEGLHVGARAPGSRVDRASPSATGAAAPRANSPSASASRPWPRRWIAARVADDSALAGSAFGRSACSARSSHGFASSNRPCQASTDAHHREHHGGDRLGHPAVRLHDRERLAAIVPLLARASAARPPRRGGRGSPSPRTAARSAARAPGLPQVALGVVAGAGPQLDDAESHQRDGAHVVAQPRPRPPTRASTGSSSGRDLAHERAVVAAPAGEGHPRGREHRVEAAPAFGGHLRRVALGHAMYAAAVSSEGRITSP